MTPAELEQGRRLLLLDQEWLRLRPTVPCPPELADGHEAFGAWLMAHGAELVHTAIAAAKVKEVHDIWAEQLQQQPQLYWRYERTEPVFVHDNSGIPLG